LRKLAAIALLAVATYFAFPAIAKVMPWACNIVAACAAILIVAHPTARPEGGEATSSNPYGSVGRWLTDFRVVATLCCPTAIAAMTT